MGKNGVQGQRGDNGQEKKPGGVTGKGFMPGRSGNPGGGPRGQTLMTLIRRRVHEGDPAEREAIITAFINAMKQASFQHLKEFIDRESGKVPDRVANADGTNLNGTDFSKLTTEELTLYRALLLKAKNVPPDA